MDPLMVSARFAAYLWFLKQEENAGKSRAEAHAFARAHWESFLPLANAGLGRLLLKMARRRKPRKAAARLKRRLKNAEQTTATATLPATKPTQTAAFFGYTWTGKDM